MPGKLKWLIAGSNAVDRVARAARAARAAMVASSVVMGHYVDVVSQCIIDLFDPIEFALNWKKRISDVG